MSSIFKFFICEAEKDSIDENNSLQIIEKRNIRNITVGYFFPVFFNDSIESAIFEAPIPKTSPFFNLRLHPIPGLRMRITTSK